MSRLPFSEVKKAREAERRACASIARHDLLTESRQARLGVTSKPQPFPKLAELLPPDIMRLFYESSLDFLDGKFLVHEGTSQGTIRYTRDNKADNAYIQQTRESQGARETGAFLSGS